MKNPKIVVLDGYPLNPGDLDWTMLNEIGQVEIYPRSTPQEVVERAKDAEILIVNKVYIGRDEVKQLPSLKYVLVSATGYNNLDIAVLEEAGIKASNVPDYGSFGVAQHAMALLLSLTNRVFPHYQDVLNSKWMESGDFSYTQAPIIELANKTIGLAGLGKIGYRMGVMAEAMGMYVSYYSRESRDNTWEYHSSFEELLKNSDVISLHLPLTDQTREMINRDSIRLMKKGAFLINTSRGQLINEKDLYDALEQGHLGGAGLDVLTQEPPSEDHILLKARNCVITPHNAWASQDSRSRILDILIENIHSYLSGNPVNLITRA